MDPASDPSSSRAPPPFSPASPLVFSSFDFFSSLNFVLQLTKIRCGSLLPNNRRCGVATTRLKFRTFFVVFSYFAGRPSVSSPPTCHAARRSTSCGSPAM
ncbi:hypothetical protein VPH35_137967 [Triticum aestivum]